MLQFSLNKFFEKVNKKIYLRSSCKFIFDKDSKKKHNQTITILLFLHLIKVYKQNVKVYL